MYGWFNIGNNVSGIMFNMVIIVFVVAIAIGVGIAIYANKQLKKAEELMAAAKRD